MPSPTRGVSDTNWREIDAKHIEYWSEAKVLLQRHSYTFGNTEIDVTFDWRPIIRYLKQHYEVMDAVYKVAGTPQAYVESGRFRRTPVRVRGVVHARSRSAAQLKKLHLDSFSSSFLYDVFLIMNLAAPGSCNYYRAATINRNAERKYLRRSNLSLSEFHFDVAYLDRLDKKRWPAPAMLDLRQTLEWYRTVRKGVSQVADSRMEKVLFALLRIAHDEDLTPSTVIWVFYALETLLDTKPGENFRMMLLRIGLLLDPDPKQAKLVRTSLRRLYDLRSAFVHGGLEVTHPMGHSLLDERADERYLDVMHAAEEGFRILLTCLQSVIARGWREPQFTESVRDGAEPE